MNNRFEFDTDWHAFQAPGSSFFGSICISHRSVSTRKVVGVSPKYSNVDYSLAPRWLFFRRHLPGEWRVSRISYGSAGIYFQLEKRYTSQCRRRTYRFAQVRIRIVLHIATYCVLDLCHFTTRSACKLEPAQNLHYHPISASQFSCLDLQSISYPFFLFLTICSSQMNDKTKLCTFIFVVW